MFRHYRVILRELAINTLPSYTSIFCTLTNKCTIISQIITLLHVSTLSCHPQTACNQYLVKLHKYILYYDQQMHNYFKIITLLLHVSTLLSSSGSPQLVPCQITQVCHMQLLVIQFKIISYMFYAAEISMFEISSVLKLSKFYVMLTVYPCIIL